ncbi:hypothetical protein JCM10213_008462 [Rhodosporidiobolus nylandii]
MLAAVLAQLPVRKDKEATGDKSLSHAEPWEHIAVCHMILAVDDPTGGLAGPTVSLHDPSLDPFRLMNNYYRQYLIILTLVKRAKQSPPPPYLKKRMLELAAERMTKAAEQVELPALQRTVLCMLTETSFARQHKGALKLLAA